MALTTAKNPSILEKYNESLRKRPMFIQSVSSAVLFAIGDIIAQQCIELRGFQHDFLRTLRGAFFSGAIMGPPLTLWFTYLNNLRYGGKTQSAIWKVFLDQILISPVILLSFFVFMSILEFKPSEILERLHKAYFSSLIRGWMVFFPTQLFNFFLIPAHLRLVFVNIVAMFWNTYLSLVNNALNVPISVSEVVPTARNASVPWIAAIGKEQPF
ncbi:hypothetical protein DL96DRAFT_1710198 [Flagelloscypha sp. PMI_526]|nr:hypothetical protein DL96DRAFT_1710198 [Flagelloscypha sp. PMI_526]